MGEDREGNGSCDASGDGVGQALKDLPSVREISKMEGSLARTSSQPKKMVRTFRLLPKQSIIAEEDAERSMICPYGSMLRGFNGGGRRYG